VIAFIVLLSILALAVLWLIAALALSYLLTRRYHLVETHCPAEVGLAFENVTFQASDSLTLRGWWIPAPGSDRAIIQMHGHGGSMDPDVQYLLAWHAAGLNVLMFDFRAHGRSEGRAVTFGYLERRDVQGAVRFVKEEKDMHRVGLVGFSLGGMVAIVAAPVCADVDAVVEDGAPARICSAAAVWAIEHHLSAWVGHLGAATAIAGASLRLHANLFAYEPIRWIGKIRVPLMMVHGDLDQYCPDFEELLAAAHPTELWRVPDVGHVQASQVYPDEYRRRVVAFLERYL
jgi:fermentation-respiration switch protein FrsA (DUF1100 family)